MARRRTVVLVALVVLLIVGASALAGLWQVSASPKFCNSCHIMEPYDDAWKASTHKEVPCVQCHYPPGFRDTLWVKFQAVTQVAKWATQTYSSKPFAEVEDASCLRSGCHARSALENKGELTFKRGIRFDHRPHLEAARMGRELRCASCHSQIMVENHFEVDQRACFTCHFKGQKGDRELTPIAGCTSCHQPPAGDIVLGTVRFNHQEVVRRGVACQSCHLEVIQGSGEAPRERCLTCHNQPEKIDRHRDTAIVHAAHVTERTIECTRCHTPIKHGLPPRPGTPTAGGGQGAMEAAVATVQDTPR